MIRNGFEVPGTIFEAMFALPQANENGTPIEGTSLDNPIILDGVAEEQFRAFFACSISVVGFYQQTVVHFQYTLTHPRSAGRPPVASLEDWVGVLHLATMWEFKLVSFTEFPFMIRTHTIISY